MNSGLHLCHLDLLFHLDLHELRVNRGLDLKRSNTDPNNPINQPQPPSLTPGGGCLPNSVEITISAE